MALEFNKPIFNFTAQSFEQSFRLKYKSEFMSDEEIDKVFTGWYVQQVQERAVVMQLNFSDPFLVSAYAEDKDKISLQILSTRYLISRQGQVSEQLGVTFTSEIPE